MSTSLGRLVLDMAANAAGFERDMQQISRSAKKELNKVNRELFFAQRDLDAARGKVTKLATAFGALSGAGLAIAGRELRRFTQEADGLDKVSRTVSLTVEELQELRFAAEQAAGVTSQTLDMAMQRFARRVGEAANDTGELNTIVKELGVELRNADGSLKSQTELLGIFADEISKAGSEQEALRIAFKLFDSEGARMVTMLRQGSGEIERLREQFRQTGATISGDTVEATVRFNDAMGVLSQNLAGMRNAFMADLIEPLSDYADFLANTEQGQRVFKQLLEDVGRAAQVTGTIIAVGFTGALVKAIVQMALAEVRVARLTAAKLTLNGASRSAAIGVTLFGRAVAIATGPVGVTIALLSTLGITYLSLQDNIRAAGEEFDEFTSRIDRARESTVAFRSAQLQSDLIEIGARVSDINAELERLQRIQIGMEQAQFGDPRLPEEMADRVRELTSEQNDLRKSAGVLNDQLEQLNTATEGASEATETSTATVEDLGRAVDSIAASLQNQIDRLREEKLETIGGTRALLDYTIAKEAANGATVEQIRELQLLRDELLDEQDALEAATGAMEERQRQAEEMANQMREVAAAFIEAATGVRIFNDENQRGAGAGQSSGGDFSTIGSGVAQSIFNGQSIGDALGSAFTGFGSQELGKVADKFFEDATTKGIGTAFENSETQDGVAGGFAMAIGQALQGQYGAAIGGAIGTEVAGPIGGMIGQVLGSLIDGLIGKKGVEIQFRGSQGSTGSDRTDRSIDTALGQVDIRFRRIEGQARDQFVNALEEMDASIAASLRGTGLLPQAREAADRFGGDTGDFDNDIEAALRQRLNAIVSTFDSFVADFVNSSESLEGQLENLASVMAVNRSLLAGATLGLPADFVSTVTQPTLPGPVNPGTPGGGDARGGGGVGDFIKQTVATISDSASGFNAAMQTMGEGVDSATVQTGQLAPELAATVSALLQVRVANEPLIDTFARTSQILGTLDTASALLGARFGQTRMDAIRFGADLATMFGDDAGKVAAQFNRVFEAFYTEAERAQAQSQMASQEATRLLTSLLAEVDGFEFEAGQLTQAGFRELFESLTSLGTLTAAQTAVLLNAGVAVADYIDAQGTLNDTQQDAADIAQQQADAQALLNRLQQETLDILAPTWGQYNQLSQAIAENLAQARGMANSEQALTAVRRLAQLQTQQFTAQLRASIQDLSDTLFGGGSDPFQDVANSVGQTAQSIGQSITSALEGVRDWLDQQFFDDASSATPAERLAEAQRQFDEAIASAMAGDASAVSDLPDLANQLLGQGASFFGTSADGFMSLEDQVRAAMEGIAGMQAIDTSPPTFSQQQSIVDATQGTQISALEQAQLASQLVQELALLSRITGDSPSEIGAEFGIPIDQLIAAVTGELPDLTGDALSTYFDDLVSNVSDELSVLMDMQAVQDAELSVLQSIDASLRDIAGRPESFEGPQRRGVNDFDQMTGGPNQSDSWSDAVENGSAGTREELREIRNEMRGLRDQIADGNIDRRRLLPAIESVDASVNRSSDRIGRAIREARPNRRGPGG